MSNYRGVCQKGDLPSAVGAHNRELWPTPQWQADFPEKVIFEFWSKEHVWDI